MTFIYNCVYTTSILLFEIQSCVCLVVTGHLQNYLHHSIFNSNMQKLHFSEKIQHLVQIMYFLQFCFSVMDLWPRVSGVFPKWSNIYGVVFIKYKLCLLNIIATDYSDNELYLFVINGVLFIKKIYNSCVSFVFCTL